MPKPITREEMEAATDNRFENPKSGVSAPSWKPDKVKTEKAEIAAEETAATTEKSRSKSLSQYGSNITSQSDTNDGTTNASDRIPELGCCHIPKCGPRAVA